MGEKALGNSTYEDYLVIEAESEVKYEFHDGHIMAMAGGTLGHAQVAANFIWATKSALMKGQNPCNIYSSDAKVHIKAANRIFYPDASVVCGTPTTSEKDANALTNPRLILEVLSESTAAFDRGAKFFHYRQLLSLQEYVIISPVEPLVDTYYRTKEGFWDIHTYTKLDEIVALKSLDCEVTMADI